MNQPHLTPMTQSTSHVVTPEAHDLFLATALAKAQAAADSCVALHLCVEAKALASISLAEWSELDEVCERWLAERARRDARAA